MERLENELFTLRFLKEEHLHRYQYATRFATGVVADCACGIGYSASILLANPAVTRYLGFDIDEKAIVIAKQKEKLRATFNTGSILSLPLTENSIDTFISLETLEHLSEPQLALEEVVRVLNPEGIFICSVPTKKYDNYCAELYGPNPYHLQTFSGEDFKCLLESKFSYVSIAVISQGIASIVYRPEETDVLGELAIAECKELENGSFFAICSNKEKISHHPVIYSGLSRISYDKEMLIPLKKSLATAEDMALERWDLLVESARINKEIAAYKEQAERIAAERLEAFNRTENLLIERDKSLAEANELILQLQRQIAQLTEMSVNNESPDREKNR